MGGKVLEYEAKTIYREGIKEGIKEGINEGMETLSKLYTLLVDAGRSEDANLAMRDETARNTFFKEFGLIK